jgi:hypothetical protein
VTPPGPLAETLIALAGLGDPYLSPRRDAGPGYVLVADLAADAALLQPTLGRTCRAHRTGDHAIAAAFSLHDVSWWAAEALLDGTASLTGTCSFLPFEHDGRRATYRVRNACCLAYKLPDSGCCASCPLRSRAERHARSRGALVAAPR